MAATVRKQVQEDEGGVDLDLVLEHHEREQASRGVFRPQGPGTFYVRILPPKKKGLYYVQFGVHFDVGMLSPKLAEYRGIGCAKETLGEECILCQTEKQLYFEGKTNNDQSKLNLAKAIRVKIRRAVNIVDMKNPGAGVLVWDFPTRAQQGQVSVATKIGALFTEWKDITHPTTGRVLRLDFEKKSDFLTCENVQATGQQTPIPLDSWREDRKDLEAYARAKLIDPTKLRLLLKDDDAPEEEAPAPTARRAAGAPDPEVVGGDDDPTVTEEATTESTEAPAEDVQPDEDDPVVKRVMEQLAKAGKLKE
jgi:hypothetical protein